ncbi:MAG: asparagine synthase (glutamine-hydrolyzing) [Acidobacteria bacterium RIFCSPLOWO2_02_FULL_68_18]|nr:MAG: asparagine synthase (glutamine-hydrolyzing) [Acidobacteria bacterium RIFCSPLOWO2_02_FULL_68_18]OFW51547.1 MAG: asparagine synthase (glutamine-hydrolyzing) [Acidobacteria bacterium RIFCSPLOWO2_12_FULL_68_19]
MERALVHRGPDDGGQVVFALPGTGVGLVNRRLAIQDLTSAGHQPMTLRCPACALVDARDEERIWLTFNGEIYNFPELREQLARSGHRFFSRSDSEVVLHLYASCGPEMFARLNGIFALAIYDGRTSGHRAGICSGDVLLARDGIGVKPLYYSESARGVLFASELKALLHCGPGYIARSLDPIAVSQYLAYQSVPAPRTVLESVRKVHPGEFLVVRRGRIEARNTFYRLPAPATRSPETLDTLADRFREKLIAAVSRQLISDVPIGAFLSGGLDSSAVVAMVHKAQPGYRVPCYTMAFDDDFAAEGSPSDLPFAERVARHLNVHLIPVHAGPRVVDRLEEVMHALDEPTGDPAPINAYLISERAHRDGLKVLLSGAGADDILGGYRRHLWLGSERLWEAMPASLRRRVAAWAGRRRDGHAAMSGAAVSARRLVKLLSQADRPQALRLIGRLQTIDPRLHASLLSPSLLADLPAGSVALPLLETLDHLPPDADPLTMMLHLEQRHFLADHNLNYLDKTTMAFGVEGRVPLLDLELVEFVATVPSRFKVAGREGKYLFKKAMEPYLPREVIYRQKTGFGVPLRRWMAGDLREAVSDVLTPQAIRDRGVFNGAVVQSLIARTQTGEVDGAYPLFSLFAFETWCRRFLDSMPTTDPIAAATPLAPSPGPVGQGA